MASSQRRPGAYDPLVSVGRPGGRPRDKPRFRVLIHKRHLRLWEKLIRRCGLQNAQQVWDHLAFRPDQPPLLGTCTPFKGKNYQGSDGWSRRYHYEITGADRLDYQFDPEYRGGRTGEPHPVVKIIIIAFGSH